MMNRTKSMADILALLLILAAGASFAQQIDGGTVLKNMLEAEGKVAFTAHQVTTLARGPSLTSEQIVYRDGFKGMRMEYIEPPPLKGEIMADDGRVLAHFIPSKKVVEMHPSRLAGLRQRTEQASPAFRRGHLGIELVGKDKIAGRTAYVIEVKPKERHPGPTRKFWVDAEKWIKLKTEDIAPDGTVVSMSYYTRIDFVDSIAEEKFRFQPPPDVRVERETISAPLSIEKARRMVNFRILEPSYVPPGFKRVSAAVVPFRHGKLVNLRYTDGVSSFSLFQTPGHVLNPRFLERLHEGPMRHGTGVYSWRHGDLNLTIVGQLPTDQMRRIAASMK